MNIKFRLMQGLTNFTMFGYWAIRALSDPHHLHISMLAFTIIGAVFGELAYRAGKKEVLESLTTERSK